MCIYSSSFFLSSLSLLLMHYAHRGGVHSVGDTSPPDPMVEKEAYFQVICIELGTPPKLASGSTYDVVVLKIFHGLTPTCLWYFLDSTCRRHLKSHISCGQVKNTLCCSFLGARESNNEHQVLKNNSQKHPLTPLHLAHKASVVI
jgi:hypothetical protein